MKKSKTLRLSIVIIGLIALFCFLLYSYLYQPHKSVQTTPAFFSGHSVEFHEQFNTDYSILLTKTVEITGKVTSVVDKGFILDETIYCQLQPNQKMPSTSQMVSVKGTVIGYDDLLNELKLNECILK